MRYEIYRPRLSNGVVKFVEINSDTLINDIAVDVYAAIPVYDDAAPASSAMSVEQQGYRLRHNTYTIHVIQPIECLSAVKMPDWLSLNILSEQTGLNIFLQRETIDNIDHVYLCADSHVVRRIVLSSPAPLDLVNMELLPTSEVMIERQDLVDVNTDNLVLPSLPVTS